MMAWLWALIGFFAGAAAALWWNKRRQMKYGKLLSFMLHEINTPLTSLHMSVMNFVQGVFGPLSKDHESWMKLLAEQTYRMGHLLADVRDLLHMEFHRDLKSYPESVAMEAIVRREIAQVESSWTRANIEVSFQAAPRLPDAHVDKDQMQRIVGTVLANARKFQTDGRVSIALKEMPPPSGAGVRRLELAVTYQGVKMASSEAQRMMRLFYPVERRGDSEVLPCVGLGLGFCRLLLERQGGRLAFQTDGSGLSCIRLCVPAASPNTSP